MRALALLIAIAIASPVAAQSTERSDNLVDGMPASVWNKLHPRAWPPAPVRPWENPGNTRAYAHILNQPSYTQVAPRYVTPSYSVPQYVTPTVPQYVTPQYVTPACPSCQYPLSYQQPVPYGQPSPYGFQPHTSPSYPFTPPSFYRPSRSPFGAMDNVNDRARREEKTGGKQCLIDGRIHLGNRMQSYDLGTETVAFISRDAASRSAPSIRLIAAQQYIALRAKSNDPLSAAESRALLNLVVR